MAQNDIYTMTPGSAVADTLQQILTKQESDKRQAVLDDVSARNVASQIRDRDDQAKTNQVYREGLIADRQDKASDRAASQGRLKALSDFASQQYPDDPDENNMWRAIEADPEKGMPMYQAWMTRKMENTGKVKPQVPAYHLPYGKSQAEPVMVPATPPLTGNQPLMVPQGDARELIHDAQPNNPPSPGATSLVEGTGPDGKRAIFRVGATGNPTALNFGAGFTPEHKLGTEAAGKPPAPLYSQQSVNNLTSSVKANPKTAATAVHAFIGQLSDPALKWDIQEFLSDPQLKSAGVEAATSTMMPPVTDHPPTPEEIQLYRNKFREVMGIIMATNAIK